MHLEMIFLEMLYKIPLYPPKPILCIELRVPQFNNPLILQSCVLNEMCHKMR